MSFDDSLKIFIENNNRNYKFNIEFANNESQTIISKKTTQKV